MTLIPDEPEMKAGLGDCAARTAAGRQSPSQSSLSRPSGRPSAIAQGPTERFVKLTRDPDLPRPARFEPTTKREGDIVL